MKVFEKIFDVIAVIIGTIFFLALFLLIVSTSYQALRDTLDKIPAEASVTASSYYTTYLSQREILYDVRYASRDHLLETEYVALDARSQYGYDKYGGLEGLRTLLENRGYEILTEWTNVLVIYKAPDA